LPPLNPLINCRIHGEILKPDNFLLKISLIMKGGENNSAFFADIRNFYRTNHKFLVRVMSLSGFIPIPEVILLTIKHYDANFLDGIIPFSAPTHATELPHPSLPTSRGVFRGRFLR
jgi:hypothetical protein